ncbi:prostatic acid phosphatase-like [Mizuhopecten yessoensis]|uniref:acid phosphatase n=1 Tax=Mizuhopecten yessoensis TaxID=6573 RepID=A0A210R3A2_MIZYE|nr:prostatic acid phosphatase-like [Mizuhopecten yessoensis]OWF55488.1 Lysosomal acid phosphatase [Mizuhopecten yessoensis]
MEIISTKESTVLSIYKPTSVLTLLTLVVLQIKHVGGDHLVLAQAVFRHGDRSPTHSFPKDRYQDHWPQGLGQLTKIGMNQEYGLGKFLRKQYILEGTYDAFLSSNYSHSEIYVRSTDKDRTLMSAYCVLSGLYPPNGTDQQWNPDLNWQPIPVHTKPLDEDFLLNMRAPCPRFTELLAKFLASEFIANFTAQHQDLINKAAELSGLPATLVGLITIVDPLFCEYTNNLNMSEWEQVIPLHPLLTQLLDFQNSYMFYTDEMAKLRGGSLLGKIIGNMESALNPPSPTQPSPKIYLYSAHDTTIVALLRVMNVFNSRTPGYSSCLMVELWTPEGQGKPYVKVLYKNVTDSDNLVVLHIPGCGKNCTLEDFTKLLKNNVPKDIQAECNPSLQQNSKSDIHVGIVVLGCLVALLALVVTALITFICKRRQTLQSYRPLSTDDDDYA